MATRRRRRNGAAVSNNVSAVVAKLAAISIISTTIHSCRGFPQRSSSIRFPEDAVLEVGGSGGGTPSNAAGGVHSEQSTSAAARPLHVPARPTTHLFIRPELDVFGQPLLFANIVPDKTEVLPDFRRPLQQQQRLTSHPRFSLPTFGQPDRILDATEMLRSHDVHGESLVPVGSVNAGVLPLAFEAPERDDRLFPPFAHGPD